MRNLARFIENTHGTMFSLTAVSRLTHLVTKKVRMGEKRRRRSHYRFVYLDATFIPLCRDNCQKEALVIVHDVDDKGCRAISNLCLLPPERACFGRTTI